MKRRNLWNWIFHAKELKKDYKEYLKCKNLILSFDDIIFSINLKKKLSQLITVHKKAWKLGFRNINLSPNKHGIFRTSSIPNMTTKEVFLGNIYGLNTHTIKYWEDHSEDLYGENSFGINPNTKVYDIVFEQYRRILRTNIQVIYNNAKSYVNEYEKINF